MTRSLYLIDRTGYAQPSSEWLRHLAHAMRLSLIQFSQDWHFEHVWRVPVVHRGDAVPTLVPEGSVPIVLVDTDTEVHDALGYHFTNPDGTPAAKVLVKTILDNGGTWDIGSNSVSCCVDHEAKETVLDMAANSYAFDWHGRAWAIEACDAVQSSSFSGPRGFSLSNYVMPGYFAPGAHGLMDKLGRLSLPFSIDRGGYAIVASYSNERQAFGDLSTMGFKVVEDPDGRGIIVADPDLPPWVRPLKLDGAARTMRRLLGEQR